MKMKSKYAVSFKTSNIAFVFFVLTIKIYWYED